LPHSLIPTFTARFMWSGTLSHSLIPIFTTRFLKRTVLQYWTYKSSFLCVLWLWMCMFCPKQSLYFLMKHITSRIYSEDTVSILQSLNIWLHDIYHHHHHHHLTNYPCHPS
jgi:hypothetical protein